MKAVHVTALGLFLALIGFVLWLGQRDQNDEKLFVGVVGLLVVVGLISLLAVIARGASETSQKLYFTIIGTLVGLVGGLAGGAAIGNQAGQAAADDVSSQVQTQVEAAQEATP